MKVLALILVLGEVILCCLIYLVCVYFRRRWQQPTDSGNRHAASSDDVSSIGSSGPTCSTKNVLVFVPYSAAKAYLGKTTAMSLKCAACVRVFKGVDDETMRLMPHCGHVFHPTCLVDPCSTICPLCRASPDLDGPDSKPEGEGEGDGEEVLDIKVVVEDNMVRLSEEVTKKMIHHAKLVLPTGKFCSPAKILT